MKQAFYPTLVVETTSGPLPLKEVSAAQKTPFWCFLLPAKRFMLFEMVSYGTSHGTLYG